jgi:hypothetical protein
MSSQSDADAAAQREYVASMSRQLAVMARKGGDEHLAGLLEAAAKAAARQAPPVRLVAES